MNEEQRESLFDLLTKKAVHGLEPRDEAELASFDERLVKNEFRSFEAAAAAVNLVCVSADEQMPANLRARILASAPTHFRTADEPAPVDLKPWQAVQPPVFEQIAEPEYRPARSWFGWLGWAAAAAAVAALAINLWLTRTPSASQQAAVTPPAETPRALSPAEQRDVFILNTPDLIRAKWAAGNVQDAKQVAGDVVWSDSKQFGYLRLTGLPKRTAPEHCYQLWIFDRVQDKATPIDGGIFDVNSDGEVIIPINAKLKTDGPLMFALTVERHGGVVVSKREQIAALAKVEGRAS